MGKRQGFQQRGLEILAQWVGPLLIKALGSTLRLEISGLENLTKARAAHGNVIYASWHGRLLIPAYLHRDEDIRVLVSTHQDGEYTARVIGKLGFGTVRGSSTRGGTSATLRLMDAAADSHDLAITPDGPRGPREKCQRGIIYLAKKTGLPLIPIGASHSRGVVLSSWDRFMIPLPFARCKVVYGEAALYDASLDEESVEKARLDLERRLRAVNEEADHACTSKGD